MFSRRASHSPVRWLHRILSIRCLLFLMVGSGLALGFVGASMGWRSVDRKIQQAQPEHSLLRAATTHRVSRMMRDVSSTPVTTVSAASYEGVAVAPESIVSAYGEGLATAILPAFDIDPSTPGIQLPTQLAGTTVEVNGRRAGLFFVSPKQINYVVPAETPDGTASVVVKSGDGTISQGSVKIVQVVPSVFTANANGSGVPAANLIRVKGNLQFFETISKLNPSPAPDGSNRLIPKAIDLGAADDEVVFLSLYATGIRRRPSMESVRVLIGGEEADLNYVGPQGDFVGLDQINAIIPRSLIGRGLVKVSVTVAGFTASNLVDIEIAAAVGNAPPKVDSFGVDRALAGTELVINGSGFSPNKPDNIVRIGGHNSDVMDALPIRLTVLVPFGVETGPVSVRTALGEGISSNELRVRTSISGYVQNTNLQPLPGVKVKIIDERLNMSATTNSNGSFVLPDVEPGPYFVEFDGGTVGSNPPYPKLMLTISAKDRRDNQFPKVIAMQQATGSGGVIGEGSTFAGTGDGKVSSPDLSESEIAPVLIKTGDFTLEVQNGTKAQFPPGSTTDNKIFLTPLKSGRTPVELPLSYFSSAIVQITPFNVKLNPGAKLTFPNFDGLLPNAPALLFRYDFKEGKFLEDKALATVTADGKFIETEPGAIKETSIYFAAALRTTTTISGRILEAKDLKTPVVRASVSFRGRQTYTDGNGSYTLRQVPANEGREVTFEASFLRASGRVDRVLNPPTAPAVINSNGGITKMPPAFMPGSENRPPTILVQEEIEVKEGVSLNIPVIVTDPDQNQSVTVKIDAPSFVSLKRELSATTSTYALRIAPNFTHAGEYKIVITATDEAGAVATEEIELTVIDVNRPPVAEEISLTIDEDTQATIMLKGTDPDNDKITFALVSQPLNGTLSGELPNLIYKPNLNFNGIDRFSYKVNDGKTDGNTALVIITVRPVNDPPVLSVPGPQTVNKGETLSFAVSASDVDGPQGLMITASGMPIGATLTPVAGTTSSQFRWTPGPDQAGTFPVTFKVTDSGTPPLSDTKVVTITVKEQAIFNPPQSKSINEGQALIFDFPVPLDLLKQVTITSPNLPEGATLSNPSPTELQQFRWTPNFQQAGEYIVKFDAALNRVPPVIETREVQIKVFDVLHDMSKEPVSLWFFGAAGRDPRVAADAGDALGSSIVTGDFNGDRIGDLAMGAPNANGSAMNMGKVYVFFGKSGMKGGIDLLQRKADIQITGEAGGDQFGGSLAVGDVNGDGVEDLIVGAPFADVGTRPGAGKVYGVYGPLIADSTPIDKVAALTILGTARNDHFGSSLATGFIHTNGGPACTLLVGAPGGDFVQAGGAPITNAGAVYGFFGGRAFGKTIESARANFIVRGGSVNAQIGSELAVGNFNRDDYDDILIGAPQESTDIHKNNGAVYLVLGLANISGSKAVSSFAALTLTGADDDDGFGASIAMGDFNRDGRADLIIGAPGGDGPGNGRQNVGEVAVLYGTAVVSPRSIDLVVYGAGAPNDQSVDALGTSLTVGDFTGDGVADLAIGAPGSDPADAKRAPTGAVYVIFGSLVALTGQFDLLTRSANLTIFGNDPGDNLGNGAIAIGAFNATGVGDLYLGIPQAWSAGNLRPGAGEVRGLFGVKRL